MHRHKKERNINEAFLQKIGLAIQNTLHPLIKNKIKNTMPL